VVPVNASGTESRGVPKRFIPGRGDIFGALVSLAPLIPRIGVTERLPLPPAVPKLESSASEESESPVERPPAAMLPTPAGAAGDSAARRHARNSLLP